MKSEKPLTPDDIELVPDSWERFKEAVSPPPPHPQRVAREGRSGYP